MNGDKVFLRENVAHNPLFEEKYIVTDIDNTLIHGEKILEKNVKILRSWLKKGFKLIAWSGGGKLHAMEVMHRLGFHNVPCYSKPIHHPYTRETVKNLMGVIPEVQLDDLRGEKIPGVLFIWCQYKRNI
jgi:phosphoserine phosphatase